MIEDARARQRSHRRIGALLVAAMVIAGALIAGVTGGGGGPGGRARGQTSGPAPSAGSAHSNASSVFPGAPSTQPYGNGVASRACPLAPPNRYLPPRSGCVTVIRADMNGDGRADLILVYSRLGREHPYWWAAGSVPPSMKHDFVADAAFLKVVVAGGGSASIAVDGVWAAAVDGVAHVNDDPGSEVFLEVSRISSGASMVAYGLRDGRLVPAGVTLGYGGDGATKAGVDCLPGNPPRLVQRTFELIGAGSWQETKVTYDWHGPKLVQISKRTFRRNGAVATGEIGVGRGCTTGVS